MRPPFFRSPIADAGKRAICRRGSGLFSTRYLDCHLREQPGELAPVDMVRAFLAAARACFDPKQKSKQTLTVFEALFTKLGFTVVVNRDRSIEKESLQFLLKNHDGSLLTSAFVRTWQRSLDYADSTDTTTPHAIPGTCVLAALEDGPADWVIVTNASNWRLYTRHADSRAFHFYEVDLSHTYSLSDEPSEREICRRWWLLFRRQAFEKSGTANACLLDNLLTGSRAHCRRVGERLQERIFRSVLPTIARGFLLGCRDRPKDKDLAELRDASVAKLFRLLSVLFTESRQLCWRDLCGPPGEPAPVSAAEKIPSALRLPEKYLAAAREQLATEPDEITQYLVNIEYSDLDACLLGTIYESLLDCELQVQRNEGTVATAAETDTRPDSAEQFEVRVVRSGHRRKSAGAFYTPPSIVRSLVSRTIGPTLQEKLSALRSLPRMENASGDLAESIFDFRVLDPAMGCGHFLVEAARFLTDILARFLAESPNSLPGGLLAATRAALQQSRTEQGLPADTKTLTDLHTLRWLVLTRCIHGVDIDPAAVELARTILWLDASIPGTAAAALEAHLRRGNSLVGAILRPEQEFRDQARTQAQRPARSFFHWHLEFPEIFRASNPGTGFDCIVGNPPFVDKKQIVRLPGNPDEYWRASGQFQTARGIYDLYMLFVERSIHLLKDRGRVGLLTPMSWLTQKQSQPLRQLLKSSGSLEIMNFTADRHFADALVKVIGVLLHRGPQQVEYTVNDIPTTRSLRYETADRLFAGRLRIDVPTDYLSILEKIARNTKPLRLFYTPTFGIRACSKTAGAFDKHHLLRPKNDCATPVPYIEAADIRDGRIEWQGRWLDYQPGIIYSARSPELFSGAKLLLPSLLSKRCIRAVYDDAGYYADQSLVCISESYRLPAIHDGTRRPSLRSLLLQLNSATISFYFAFAIVGESLGGGAIHATPGLVAELPIFPGLAAETPGSPKVDGQIWSICSLQPQERRTISRWYAAQTATRAR